MDPAAERRRELGQFLRSRREHLVRADFDLPPVGRGRRVGLRREEVSYLSGVSLTWLTWLEQGRNTNPSRQVLEAVARAMRLPVADQTYVLTLAGYAAPPADALAPVTSAPAPLQRLLDGLGAAPAFAVTAEWGIAGWNAAYGVLYPGVDSVPPAERNLLWLVFTDPAVRAMLPDWETDSRRFLAEFRAQAGPSLGAPGHAALIAKLLEVSPEFRQGWEAHDVERFTSRERRFRHPVAGDLAFEQHRLTPVDHRDLHLVVYTPAPGTDTGPRLERLLRRPPPPPLSR